MKVIAIIDKEDYGSSKVLVETTKSELENIRGNWIYSSRPYGNSKEIKVGSLINVSNIYDNARKIIDYYDNFKKIIEEFGNKAKFLKKILDARDGTLKRGVDD